MHTRVVSKIFFFLQIIILLIMHLIIGYGLFWTYHRFCNKINTTGATSRVGTAYPSGAPEFTPVFSGFVLLHL